MRTGGEKQELGRHGEALAEEFLRSQGYAIVVRNYRCVYGEIDLVARERDTLVFVEVRTQSGRQFGDPLESVTLRKQRQIARAAMHYVMRQRVADQPLRFDVVGIRWEGAQPRITHVRSAFELPQGKR